MAEHKSNHKGQKKITHQFHPVVNNEWKRMMMMINNKTDKQKTIHEQEMDKGKEKEFNFSWIQQ